MKTTRKSAGKTLAAIGRRTIIEITKKWRDMASSAVIAITGRVRPDVPEEDEAQLIRQVSDSIYARGGEIASTSRAVDLGMTYLHLTEEGREKFLKFLAQPGQIKRLSRSICLICCHLIPESLLGTADLCYRFKN